MSKYLETKKEYPDCILFYRLGDFYELFFDDAITGSRELEITLTGKDCGLEERAPMCGVPYHAVDSYLNKLVSRGYKVAIAEQTEDPKTAKGIVKREVIRVVTPGTNTDLLALSEDKNNYLLCVYYETDLFGLAFIDITTGDFSVTQVSGTNALMDEISKFPVAELISNRAFMMSGADLSYIKDRLGIACFDLDDSYFDERSCEDILKRHFKILDLSGLGIKELPTACAVSGAALKYLYETQKTNLDLLNTITVYNSGRYMVLDAAARRNLEITETLRDKNKKGSLLWILDKTKTALGARRLRSFLEQPLIDRQMIGRRLDGVEELLCSPADSEELREYLACVYDLERLLAKISYRSANPRDLLAFKNSLEMLPAIKGVLENFGSDELSEIYSELDPLSDLYELLESAVNEDAPVTIREGGIIKEGYNEQVDKYRSSKLEGKTWLAQLEEKEKNLTGIKSLKVRFNKVFGYYIEVTNTFKDQVPDRYIRKQTLVNAERYITDELKQLEDIILGAEEKLFALEYDLFTQIREQIASQMVRIQKTARAVSYADAYSSLAYIARANGYVRPKINTDGIIDIKDGRHPVVEQMTQEAGFIPNDVYCDEGSNRVSIITGPNMAGKSTYMRQMALIVLMAQIGSFVPASSADICVCDRIFTRVGASDDLSSGQSTFMVEMTDVANILRNATKDSLIILDEIGRGTSTYDGLSIAWATIEYIADKKKCGAKTLFSTHYHELTELEGVIDGVKNYCISVKEKDDNIIFLRKVIRGGADKSYGIQVAALAGVPRPITERAKQIVSMLGKDGADIKQISEKSMPETPEDEPERAKSIIEERLESVDPDSLTPLEALNILYELKNEL